MQNKNTHIEKYIKNNYFRRYSRNNAILFGIGAILTAKCALCVGYFGGILTTGTAFLGHVGAANGNEGNKSSVGYFFPSIIFGSLTFLSISGLGIITFRFGRNSLRNFKEFRKYNDYCKKYINNNKSK